MKRLIQWEEFGDRFPLTCRRLAEDEEGKLTELLDSGSVTLFTSDEQHEFVLVLQVMEV